MLVEEPDAAALCSPPDVAARAHHIVDCFFWSEESLYHVNPAAMGAGKERLYRFIAKIGCLPKGMTAVELPSRFD